MRTTKMEKQDLFRVLIEKGVLLESGLEGFTPYRIIKFQGKKFKLILQEGDLF